MSLPFFEAASVGVCFFILYAHRAAASKTNILGTFAFGVEGQQ